MTSHDVDRPRGTRAITVAALVAMMSVVTGSMAWANSGQTTATSATTSAQVRIQPTSGQSGAQVKVQGKGFMIFQACAIQISFTDAAGNGTTLRVFAASESFRTVVTIPSGAAVGAGTVTAGVLAPLVHCTTFYPEATAPFDVIP